MKAHSRIPVFAVGIALAAAVPAVAQDHAHHGDPATVGAVEFPTTCNAAAPR